MSIIPPGRRRKGLLHQKSGSLKRDGYLDSAQWSGHKYDEATGQIYNEKTTRVLSLTDRIWTHRSRVVYARNDEEERKQMEAARAWEARRILTRNDPAPIPREGGVLTTRRVKGARSLQSVALEQVIQHITDLTPGAFEYMPITLVKRIWDVARKRCFISFSTWALFSKMLYEESYISQDLLQYAEAFSTPNLSLDLYTKPITSFSFDFITSLCITTPFPFSNLIRLTDMRNLGALEIINTDISVASYAQMGVNDRLIKAWHLVVKNEGAFPVLRILRLWNHEDLTSKSLAYLNTFPALAVYDVRGCGFDSSSKVVAQELGWKLSIETDVLKVLKRACRKRRENLQKHSSAITVTPYDASNTTDIKRISRDQLHALLRSPNPQTPPEQSQPILNALPAFPRRPQTKTIRPVQRDSEYMLQRSQKLDACEANTYQMYARVGELRRETDLERAGIPINEFVSQGHELLNPIPMVLLRLGKSSSSLMLTTRTSIHAQCFIRINVAANDEVNQSQKSESAGQPQGPETLILRSLPSQGSFPVPSSRKPQTSVQKSKKRTLDDVLGSFY